jgi:hypothetical protein
VIQSLLPNGSSLEPGDQLLSKALSFSCSAVVSTDGRCSSFATCRVIVSSMTHLPAAVGDQLAAAIAWVSGL